MRFRGLTLLSVLGAAAAVAGPFAEVWPYQARRLGEGVIEYSYDLSSVRSANATDARATHGDEALAAFIKGLPRDVKVRLGPPSGWSVSGARGLESLPLAASFAATSDDGYASVDPLGRQPKSRMRAPFDPDQARVLPSADLVLWRVLRLIDGTLAAVALDSDALTSSLVSQARDRLRLRLKDLQGDAREGAVVLLARLTVAQSCLEPARVSAREPEVLAEATAQLEAFQTDPTITTPTGFGAWSPALTCAHRRAAVLGQAFFSSRAGWAAPLTWLALLDANPDLKARFETLRARRDLFEGVPATEPLTQWREKLSGQAGKTLDDLGPFIDGFGPRPPAPPPLLAPASTPFGRFFSGLEGAERLAAVDELWAAAQDKRLQFPSRADAPVEALRQAALGALAPDDGTASLQFDAAWRDRLDAAFSALQGSSHELKDSSWEAAAAEVERSDLVVKLKVPALLEVEPVPRAYDLAADALDRVATVLQREGLGALHPLQPDGPSLAETAYPEARRWEAIARGLARLASVEDLARPETPQTQAARRFLAAWRSDGALSRDVRLQEPGPVAFDGQRAHAVTLGVGRREMAVAFLDAPSAEVVGGAAGVQVDRAEQRYLVPVLVTTSLLAPASAPARGFKEVRALINEAGRLPSAAEGAVKDAAGR